MYVRTKFMASGELNNIEFSLVFQSEVKGTLLMKNMAITYEVSCDFENYKKSGSVYIIFDMLRFEAQVGFLINSDINSFINFITGEANA